MMTKNERLWAALDAINSARSLMNDENDPDVGYLDEAHVAVWAALSDIRQETAR